MFPRAGRGLIPILAILVFLESFPGRGADLVQAAPPDAEKPRLAGVWNEGPTRVAVKFNEAVDPVTGLVPAHYQLDRGVAVREALAGRDSQTVLLTTTALTYGETYTLSVSNVTDLAVPPNAIASDARLSFVASEYAPADVGTPALGGGTVRVPGGVDVTGGGRTIGGASDQFQFGWQEQTGNFDVEARVLSVTGVDPFLKAGWMARDNLTANARFAAAFASSVQLGCFFQSRTVAGAAATTAAPRSGFPVNTPYTWLRLQRSGNTLIGYASVDGASWTSLGSVTFSGLPATLYLGFAVTGDHETAPATARFRDIGPTRATTTTTTLTAPREPVGPSSRATGMIFSEIMYRPMERADGRNLEFVELHNARSVPEDLTGWRLSGEVDFRFPDGFRLAAGETVVVAAAPEDLRAVYGITNVLGPFTNALPSRGTLRLRNNADALRLEVEYSDQPPWPVAADGAGHSLVLARPSYGENDVRAWGPSELRGGSPGIVEPIVPAPETAVVLNEFLAHTDDPVFDFIELHNRSTAPVDLSGCVLTDDVRIHRFRIPAGTVLEPRGFVSWDQNQLGFSLRSGGESLYLVSSNLTRVLDAVRFGGQENGVATGRSPDGSPTFRRLAQPTPSAANAPWRRESVIIHEILYNPISRDDDDEFVELHNRGTEPVNLAGWRFESGIDFRFPTHAVLPAGGYAVVARNAERLKSRYPLLSAANTFGNFSGSLRNSGDRLALSRPDEVVSTNEFGLRETNVIHIVVAEVAFADGGRWGRNADGGGSSLELIDPHADPLRAANWADSDETAKAPWTSVEVTGRIDNANGTANRLYVSSLGGGECLIDDIEVLREGSTNVVQNGNFESGTTGWTFSGNHSASGIDLTGAATGAGCLHLRAGGDGDTGPNTARNALRATLPNNVNATLRAKVRWLSGWPQVLFRLRGNGLELAANLTVPNNPGTPGQANSRRVANAGPAIHDVSHAPPLPAANEPVRVTCRVSDPDGVASVRLQYRIDPATTLTTVSMRDDGQGGDELAGDGVYTGRIPAQTTGRLVAFRVSATDDAASPGAAVFPALAPAEECLVRWGDTVPFGTFAHYHLWYTQATQGARGNALNNTWRDATLVYNGHRVIYNTGFRDKGSPFHSGSGDIALATPADEPLLGAHERVLASTGNGGSEPTGIRSQLAAWFGQQLGIPYLHAHYLRLYVNGNLFREVNEDLEQPDHDYARRWFPDADEGDLYKIAVWFEFDDGNSSFQSTGATIQRFTTLNGEYKLARYRWNWQRRSIDGDATNYRQILDLATVLNDTSASYVNRTLDLADLNQWMRVFCFDYAMGNWDAWTYNIGQNMYIYKPGGRRWALLPWDIDFTFGLGDGTSAALRGGGQDPTMSRAYANPTFQRMNWRAYQDTIQGPFLAANFQPQIDARRSVLLKNGITGLQDPRPITTWINSRRTYIANQIAQNDAKAFEITSNAGADFEASTSTVTLDGTAPFAVATLEVNGVPHPVTWSNVRTFRVTVPLTAATNSLTLVGRDARGNGVAGATDAIVIRYPGAVEKAEDFVVINEVHYDLAPAQLGSAFVELFNRSSSTPFDLSGGTLSGIGYTFPRGTFIQPGAYLVLAADRLAFAQAFGVNTPVFDQFTGTLDNNGERLALLLPGTSGDPDRLISDVRYGNRPPWPTNAAGLGPSLQLIDPSRGSWRVANWTTTSTNDPNRVTPGRANAAARSLPPFPPLWINEVQAHNVNGLADSAGDRDPWIELHNAGTETLDLSAYFLTDNFTNLTRWPFPPGTTLAPGAFLVVWADGESAESRPGEPHAGFRLDPTTGAVALARIQGSPAAPAVLDYLEYEQLSAGRSVGSHPDGEPRRRRQFVHVTPGAANNPEIPPILVRINELMPGNTRTLADPADGDFDDWFELHNAGPSAVDLSTYTLTDNLTNATQYAIPPGTILPAGGYLLVWADEETGQNGPGRDLHANFRLSAGGEQLGLFAPDGSLVDGFAFEAVTNDVSLGLFPDGGEPPRFEMATPTPRGPNSLVGANRPPVFDPLPTQTVAEGAALNLTVRATDPEGLSVVYSLGDDAPPGAVIHPTSGLFTWFPGEADGPRRWSFVLRATDEGTPVRVGVLRVTVDVTEVNRPPVLDSVPVAPADEGTLFTLQFGASDPDLPPAELVFSLGPDAPAGATLTEKGEFRWVPDESLGETDVRFTVRVAERTAPSFADERLVTLRVREVPNPPEMPFIPPQTTDEGTSFRLTVVAADPDTPPSPLRYTLEAGPAGAMLDPATGQLTWSPGEEVGPTNAIFVVRATEVNPPEHATTRTFGVRVHEVNEAPVLAELPPQTVREGGFMAVQARAADADLPAQGLVFSLDSGAPAGMTIDSATGWVLWAVGADAGPSTHDVVVRVTDDGPGALSARRALRVVVTPQPHLVIHEIMYRPATNLTEFIEVLNNSAHQTESLAGVELTAGNLRFEFPAEATLAPGAMALVVRNRPAFIAAYGNGLPVAGEWTGTLNPSGDTLRLLRPVPGGEAAVLDEVRFAATAPWPAAANGGGGSLQLRDPLQDNSRVANWDATTGLGAAQSGTLLGMTNTWRYNQSGIDLGAAWRAPDFNDTAWPSGNALFYVETAPLPAAKNTPLTLGPMTYYFRTGFDYTGPLGGVRLSANTILDDAAVIYLNGVEVLRVGFNANTQVGFSTPADRGAVGDAAVEGPFDLQGSPLRAGRNTVAVEVHQNNMGSSDVVWGMNLAIEATAAGATPGRPNSLARPLPAFPPIWINEVQANNLNGPLDNAGERAAWIELVNAGPLPVTLDGWYLTDSGGDLRKWAFPPGVTVDGGAYRVFWADGETTETTSSDVHVGFHVLDGRALALVRDQPGGPAVVDYLVAPITAPDQSFGSLPDAQSLRREVFQRATPAAPNLGAVPIPEIALLEPAADGALRFRWATVPGVTYRVEATTDIDGGPWQVLGQETATGDALIFTDLPTGTVRFYRVVVR